MVIGAGASGGASAAEIAELIGTVLAEAGAAPEDVRCVATATGRAGTAAVRAAAGYLGFPFVAYPVDVLAQVDVPHPSEIARARTGTASVAEAAALHAATTLLDDALSNNGPASNTQPNAQPGTRSGARPDTPPPDAQPDARPDTPLDAQPDARTSAQPGARSAARPDTAPGARPVVRLVVGKRRSGRATAAVARIVVRSGP
ncbi:cobalamin biosynthesis protein [Actinomadura fibrosa]|uniref:Cobalamin biosynthesis protein n=1 Tax=Actinomadura fibrosa TaxID=111802 RepID=A0ABW2XML5_9ACTN|nr:cobalamin biosynthesis protein [Actinomadura fibrosa]